MRRLGPTVAGLLVIVVVVAGLVLAIRMGGLAKGSTTAHGNPPTLGSSSAAAPTAALAFGNTSHTPSVVSGFAMPIGGACLTDDDTHLPGAARPYRYGVHEGLDFYDGHVCALVRKGTPVLAAKSGTVSVATINYHNLTEPEWEGIQARSRAAGNTSPQDLSVLRGRQVEIDHRDGTRTRYAHLSAIAPGVRSGVRVQQGQVIGYVGNSGTNESIACSECEMHLHFEIRVGDTYFGVGLSPDKVRALYEKALFNP